MENPIRYAADFVRNIDIMGHPVKYVTILGIWAGRDIVAHPLSYPAGTSLLGLGLYHSATGDIRGVVGALGGAAIVAAGHLFLNK